MNPATNLMAVYNLIRVVATLGLRSLCRHILITPSPARLLGLTQHMGDSLQNGDSEEIFIALVPHYSSE